MRRSHQQSLRSGFTLVEIMIVVGIIGLLAAMAAPAFAKARMKSRVNRAAADLRVIEDAFKLHSMMSGGYPADAGGQNGLLTGDMGEYIRPGIFETEETPLGGRYRWINANAGLFSYAYIVSITDCTYCGGPATDLTALAELDKLIDDGNSLTGRLRKYGGLHYHYVVEFK